tara:strand:+ start:7296 stop:7544 length:249 start_codon:yes stop_codon:yes gene_type:complete
MCIFKQYKNIFGEPNLGVHSYRFFDAAIVDHIGTILLAILSTHFTKMPLELTIPIWYIIGIISHYLFGVSTNTLKYLNITCD